MATTDGENVSDFDPKDEDSWHFGPLSRQESVELLRNDPTDGTFLVRESTHQHGDYVLSVRQGGNIRHYMITRSEAHGHVEYVIGDLHFHDLPSLLEFYKTHYLDQSALSHPAPKRLCKTLPAKAVVLRSRIPNSYDTEQLRLYEGEIVTVTKINANGHWEGEIDGRRGSFPFTHVRFLDKW